MSRNKTLQLKLRLIKKMKQNKRIPVLVIGKTNRRITINPKSRNWRNQKLKLKVK
jgi:large subunit ribosomal protein L39e